MNVTRGSKWSWGIAGPVGPIALRARDLLSRTVRGTSRELRLTLVFVTITVTLAILRFVLMAVQS